LENYGKKAQKYFYSLKNRKKKNKAINMKQKLEFFLKKEKKTSRENRKKRKEKNLLLQKLKK